MIKIYITITQTHSLALGSKRYAVPTNGVEIMTNKNIITQFFSYYKHCDLCNKCTSKNVIHCPFCNQCIHNKIILVKHYYHCSYISSIKRQNKQLRHTAIKYHPNNITDEYILS